MLAPAEENIYSQNTPTLRVLNSFKGQPLVVLILLSSRTCLSKLQTSRVSGEAFKG